MQVAGRAGHGLGAVAVALRGAGIAELMRLSADDGRQFGFDQRLVDQGCCLPNSVFDVGALSVSSTSSRADWSRAIVW